jgi:PAS domain S-box-containing protein
MAGREVGSTIREETRSPLRALLRGAFDAPAAGVVESAPGVWYEVDALPFRNDQREDLLLVVARDISSRRRAEGEREALYSAMTRSEERFRQLFENAPTGIALTSAEGDQAGRFLQVNEAFARMLGRSRTEIEGRDIAEVTHPDDVERTTVVLAGGTARPTGFLQKFEQLLRAEGDFPVPLSEVRMASDPLTATARGCYIAALSETK